MSSRVSWAVITGGLVVAAAIAGVIVFVLPDSAGLTYTDRAFVKEAVGEGLLDAASAQFKFKGRAGPFYCGEVNAKNAFGAYSGFSTFIVDRRAGRPVVYTLTGSPQSTFSLQQEIANGSDHEAKVDLARCDGVLQFKDEKGRDHLIYKDGTESCPIEKDSLHPC